MKKIASAVLFVSMFAAANVKAEEGVISKYWKKATIGTVSTAGLVGLGYLIYKDAKGDQKLKATFDQIKKHIGNNDKAYFYATVATVVLGGGATEVLLRGENSWLKQGGNAVVDGTVATGNAIATGATATYNGVKAVPGLTVKGLKAINPFSSNEEAPALD